MAGVNSLALPACPAAGQSEAEKFPLLPPKRKKPLYLEMQIRDPATVKGGGFAEVPWSLGFTELRWTDPRHLHILGRECLTCERCYS